MVLASQVGFTKCCTACRHECLLLVSNQCVYKGYQCSCHVRALSKSNEIPTISQDLNDHVPNCTQTPKRYQTPTDLPVHPPPIQRHDNKQSNKCDQQRHPTDHQGGTDFDLERLIRDRPVRMLVMPLFALVDRHVHARQTYTEQNIQHRAAKASTQRHDGETELRNRNVGNEVSERVANSEDREAKNSVRDAQDDAEGFEDAHDFVRDGRDPCNGDREAEKAEEWSVLWRPVWCCEAKNEKKAQQGED